MNIDIRRAEPNDLRAIRAIQATAPEASQGSPGNDECWVAILDGRVVGFLVTRGTGPGEKEILNLAVDQTFRRRGVATALLKKELANGPAARFLEVRESNLSAIRLYRGMGFRPVGVRKNYYNNPPEAAIVMRLDS